MYELAIVVKNVHKSFKLPHEKHTSIKSLFVNLFHGRRTYEKQRVLNDVSLEIKKGEFFGIIGRNGNGKSTLLKLLAGVYAPDKGQITVNGKLTPFIELGVGFNPELTGRENVYLNGALLGFSSKEMDVMYDDIVEFAEIKQFMDQKLKNYSSGMQVRLAFSIAIRAKSDILLIDEVLAVGDTNFQKKCIEVFEQLKREGRTIVFVSHAMSYIRDFCDRVAVISDGRVVYSGRTEKGIDIYNKLNAGDEELRLSDDNIKKKDNKNNDFDRLGNGKAVINNYKFLDNNNKEVLTLESGSPFRAVFDITAKETINNCSVGVMFRKNPQENLYGINTFLHGYKIDKIIKGSTLKVSLKDDMPLNPGTYYVSFAAAVMNKSGYEDLDNLNNVMRINVFGPEVFWGAVHSRPQIQIEELNNKAGSDK